ncbi:MAG: hypothetical protein GY827_08250 [Cytophagales bacterium]|nr:hypothetical protein [Cytophagales bacterium]
MARVFFFMFLTALLCIPAQSSTQISQNNLPCRVFGTIYIEQNHSMAHFSVFLEEYEEDADLIVYKSENRLFADKAGLWYIVTDRNFADYTIYIESNKAYADFSVYYTDDEGLAGCIE